MTEKYEVILTESFTRKYQKIKDSKQKKIILKFFDKLRDKGINIIKILYSIGNYVFGEMKSYNPAYRLYVIFDRTDNTFYFIEWEHKNKQQQIIEKIKTKLKLAMKNGLDSIF